jgi:hypothetical protein
MFLGLASVALFVFAAWVIRSSVRYRKTVWAGQVISKSKHPLAYAAIMTIWTLTASFILIVALHLVLGWDVRFWLR